MDSIDTSNAVDLSIALGLGFKDCTPGENGTFADADWLNGLQYELLSLITAGGITPLKFNKDAPNTYNQVTAAIRRIDSLEAIAIHRAFIPYVHPALVKGSDGQIYQSIAGGNLANDPVGNGAVDWIEYAQARSLLGYYERDRLDVAMFDLQPDDTIAIGPGSVMNSDAGNPFKIFSPSQRLVQCNIAFSEAGPGALVTGASAVAGGEVHVFIFAKADGTRTFAVDDQRDGANAVAQLTPLGYIHKRRIHSTSYDSFGNLHFLQQVAPGRFDFRDNVVDFSQANPGTAELTPTTKLASGVVANFRVRIGETVAAAEGFYWIGPLYKNLPVTLDQNSAIVSWGTGDAEFVVLDVKISDSRQYKMRQTRSEADILTSILALGFTDNLDNN